MTLPFENDTSAIVKRISNRNISANRKRNIFTILTIVLASTLLSAMVLYGFGVSQEIKNHNSKTAQVVYRAISEQVNHSTVSNEWSPQQQGYKLPERVTLGISVKEWGISNSLTGFTTISFCGLYLSIIFIILSCAVLAFEQLSAIDKNRKNYEIIDCLGVSNKMQGALIRKELSIVFFIPLLIPVLFTILLISGAQVWFGEAILQEGIVLLYGLITISIFCAIYFTYFGATLFLFKRVILRSEIW